MGSLRLLLAMVLAALHTSSASTSLGCTRKDLIECLYPMTNQKMKYNQDFPLEMSFNEVCSKSKTCMDAYVSSCLDKEAQEFYSEGSETFIRVRKEVCGMTPLKDDITKHLNCWSTAQVKQATEECKKIKHVASKFANSLWPDTVPESHRMIWAIETVPQKVESFTESVCLLAKLALKCSWPLIQACDLKSKDCLPGYLLHSVNAYSTS